MFDADTTIQTYIQKGTVKIVVGDALKEDDVRNGWIAAAQFGPVDAVLFTVGTSPSSLVRTGSLLTLGSQEAPQPSPWPNAAWSSNRTTS